MGHRFQIFVSSPGDVGVERTLAERVIARLAGEFRGRGCVEPFFWEHQPVGAHSDFQSQLRCPRDADIVV